MTLKSIVVGDAAVGKTSITGRYVTGKFKSSYKATIGTDIFTTRVQSERLKVTLLIYDTGGQERFRPLVERYFIGAIGALLVYDVTNRESFENLPTWARQVDRHASQAMKIVIGNKVDLVKERVVRTEEGKGMAKQLGASFIETSAKDGTNVPASFEQVVQFGLNRVRGRPIA